MDMQGHAIPTIVERLLLGLVPALRSGEEAATLHARRLTTALQVSLDWACVLCTTHDP